MSRRLSLPASPPLPLLITGISGVAGYNALAYFQARYPGRVIGMRQRDNWRFTGPGIVACDAEELILREYAQACILRISLPMGISFNGHAGAIDWIQSRFRKEKPATLYFDEVRTPTYTDCLSPLCEAVLTSNLRGLYHAGGPRRLSLFQIAQIINRVGGYDPKLLMGCPRVEAGPLPPRAGNVSMDSTKLAKALGFEPFHPWPYDELLVPTHPRWHHERDSIDGSPELLARVLYRNPLRATPISS